MIFVPKLIDNYTIDREVVEGIGRHYRIKLDDNSSYLLPSMTTVLHQEEPIYIKNWKKRVGSKVVYASSNIATEAGTALHLYCEHVLLRNLEEAKQVLNSADSLSKFYMKKITPYLRNVSKVYASEEFMFDLDIGIAGTVDAVCIYKGKLCILDFKTANMPRDINDIENYYIQCAGYASMWKYLTGERIDDIMILMVNQINVQEISENVNKYTDKFRRIVAEFHTKHGRVNG